MYIMNISNRLGVNNWVTLSLNAQNMDTQFLSGFFWLEKCQELSLKDRDAIEEAFSLACRAHATKIRKDGTPYMNHISDVLWEYIRITRKKYVLADNLIVVILHDVLEDHPEFAPQIEKKFGFLVFQWVESLSKPSSRVITASQKVRTQAILSWRWTQVIQAAVIWLVRQLVIWEYLTPEYMSLKDYIKSLPVNDPEQTESVQFLMKIMRLSPDDFEIKCADRISNLRHLTAVSGNYLIKNLFSTWGYILKAKALGRNDLVCELESGMSALACQLEKKLPTEHAAFFQSFKKIGIGQYWYQW